MIKKALLFVLAIFVVATYPASAFAYSGSGTGTPSNPYLIYTCAQLQEMRDNLTSDFRLENDINCSGVTNWEPVGFYSGTPFTGTLDGQNYGIYNLSYNGDGPAGVFGYTTNATITNLSLVNTVTEAAGTVGSLVGDATLTTIDHVTAISPTVTSTYAVGGLVGIADTVTMTDSAVYNATLSSPSNISADNFGGLMGISESSTIHRSSSSGTIDISLVGIATNMGGLIGNSLSDQLFDTYSTMDVNGTASTGGLIGNAASTSITRSYSSGTVTGTNQVGGIVGYGGLMGIINSFSSSPTSGSSAVGGVMGRAVGAGSSLTGTTWDITRSGQTQCVGDDQSISLPADCTGVLTLDGDPQYFTNTSTLEPLDTWSFGTVWQTTDDLPILITTPARADNVRVVRTSTSLTVSWETPANTGGSAITSYDLRYRPSSALSSTTVTGLPASSPSLYTISGLMPDTEYTIEIRAHNSNGTGIWSGFITTTLPATTASSSSTASPLSSFINTDIAEQIAESMTPISTPITSQNSNPTSESTKTEDCCSEPQNNNPLTIVWIVGGIVLGLGGLIWLLRVLSMRRPV